ncbi:MAG: hypothetical protein EF811_03445 [Methanonatronarchaeia archaeon]|nr:MAG: hypothetical protein EF811_03445 [Methanonatronarchaeia archaeon]
MNRYLGVLIISLFFIGIGVSSEATIESGSGPSSVTEGDTATYDYTVCTTSISDHDVVMRLLADGSLENDEAKTIPAGDCVSDSLNWDTTDKGGSWDMEFRVWDSENSEIDDTYDIVTTDVNVESDFALTEGSGTSEVAEGDTATYDYSVENTGSGSGDVTVELWAWDKNGDDEFNLVDSDSYTLSSGGSSSGTLSWTPSTGDGGREWQVEVYAVNDQYSDWHYDDFYIDDTYVNDWFDLTVGSGSNGQVTSPGEGTYTYEEGTSVDLLADPDSGYDFDQWTGDTGDISDVNSADTSITMNSDYSITANFQETERTLTVDSTSGGVVVDPGEGTFTYTDGEAINLLAEADSGYDFLEWTGDTENITSPGSEDTSMVMNNHNSISAEFGEEVVADLTTDFSDPVYAGDSLTASLSCGYSDASKSFEWRNGDGDVMGTGSSYTVSNHGGSVNVVGNCSDSYGRSDGDDSGYSSVRGVLDVSTSGVYNGVSGGVDYGFNVDVTENYTGDSISPDSFTFDFNNETFGSVDVSDGSISVPTAGVEPGEYTVSYSGDKDLYDADSGSLSFTVSPSPVFSHEVGWDLFAPSSLFNSSWIDSASSVDDVVESDGVLELKW